MVDRKLFLILQEGLSLNSGPSPDSESIPLPPNTKVTPYPLKYQDLESGSVRLGTVEDGKLTESAYYPIVGGKEEVLAKALEKWEQGGLNGMREELEIYSNIEESLKGSRVLTPEDLL